jgi:hypothetical protein
VPVFVKFTVADFGSPGIMLVQANVVFVAESLTVPMAPVMVPSWLR